MKKKFEYKIYSAKTIRQSFIDCINDGARPLTTLECLDAQAKGLVPKNFYDVATLDIKKDGLVVGVRDATKEDLKKICNGTYNDADVRPWYVGDLNSNRSAAGGNYVGLDSNSGRLVGVKVVPEAQKKKKVR